MTAPSGPPPPDLLASGDDRPPRTWSARRRRAVTAVVAVAAVVAVGVGAGVLVQQDRTADERRRLAADQRAVVRLSLLASGEDGAPRHGPRPPGVHLVVGNAGPASVRLLGATLEPQGWQVADPPPRELRPGRSVKLELTPPPACDTPAPRALRLEALPQHGRARTATLDLAAAQLAYGGTLDQAVAAAALGCDPHTS